jgi:hypothetical protein
MCGFIFFGFIKKTYIYEIHQFFYWSGIIIGFKGKKFRHYRKLLNESAYANFKLFSIFRPPIPSVWSPIQYHS